MRIRALARHVTPPIFIKIFNRFRIGRRVEWALPEWEYMPDGWNQKGQTNGWDAKGIVSAYDSKWEQFTQLISSSGPLGVAHEAINLSNRDISAHNTIISFAYALSLASRDKRCITMLDWGGGIGHYKIIANAVIPDVDVKYFCKDLPNLCARGRQLIPDGVFFDDNGRALDQTYDFVLASSSLQYSEDWSGTLMKLACVADPYLFVTSTPFISHMPSFVVMQRPYKYNYGTEYLGWFINRHDFLDTAFAAGLQLVRETLCYERPFVPNAPEQCQYGGFLFKRKS